MTEAGSETEPDGGDAKHLEYGHTVLPLLVNMVASILVVFFAIWRRHYADTGQ